MDTVTDYRRKWCISWDQYFMGVALITAQRSKDPAMQVGTCIVNDDNRIVSTGYNGMPNGCDDSKMPWGKRHTDNLRNKSLYVCHSEVNAILNTHVPLKGCRLYVTLFPCNDCAKVIIQAGIREVVYHSDVKFYKDSTKASKFMLQAANVTTRQYIPTELTMTIGKFHSKL